MKKISLLFALSFACLFAVVADDFNKASRFLLETYLSDEIIIKNELDTKCKVRWSAGGKGDSMSLKKGEKNTLEGNFFFSLLKNDVGNSAQGATMLVYVFSNTDKVDMVFEGLDDMKPVYKIVKKQKTTKKAN